MVQLINAHNGVYSIEPIRRDLPIAQSTYYAAKQRRPSRRAQQEARVGPVLLQLWRDDFGVYVARTLRQEARRDGLTIGRDSVARLMREPDVPGVNRSNRVRTTRPKDGGVRHADLVDREFHADRTNRLWATDLTFVPI